MTTSTTATGKARCVTCEKEKSTVRCDGCFQSFCFNHLMDHRQELSKQFDEIEVSRDLLRQSLTEHTTDPQISPLMKQIDQWERDSINKIRQTAEEARQSVLKHANDYFTNLEIKLNKLTEELRQCREENDYFETDLQQWQQQLDRLKKELNQPSGITLSHSSTSLLNKISVDISVASHLLDRKFDATWHQNGITIAGGNGNGSGLHQLYSPQGLHVDDDQTVYVADSYNHRIIEWKVGASSGHVVAGGNGKGNRKNQLNGPVDVIVDKHTDSLIISDYGNERIVRWPRRNGTSGEVIISGVTCYGLAMDNDGYLYISDYDEHEVRRWKIGDTSGILVAGGNGRGNGLNQLSGPMGVFVDQDHSVYVSDHNNHRVMKWMKHVTEGVVVAGDHGAGKSLTQLSHPWGVVVDQLGTVYVAEYFNYRVTRWLKGATQGTVVVGINGQGTGTNSLNYPMGLTFNRQGDLYVVDGGNHRVQKFNILTNTDT